MHVMLFPGADHGVFAPVDSLAGPLGSTAAAPGFFDAVESFLLTTFSTRRRPEASACR
jgi:hypothetical protein